MECNVEQNLEGCACTYPSCKRKGKCCLCVRHHRERGEIPGCFFKPEVERTFDRSITNFLKTQKG